MTRITFGLFPFFGEHPVNPRLDKTDKEPAETVAAPTVFRNFLLFMVLLGFGMSLKLNEIRLILASYLGLNDFFPAQKERFKNGGILNKVQRNNKDFLFLRQPHFS
jgi:hypothetical protein